MQTLKIALQKKGRLSAKSLELLLDCGIQLPKSERKLQSSAKNFPLEILYLRDDDIPQYVEQGVADIGILGENEVWEKSKNVNFVRQLEFANCRLSLAIPKAQAYSGISFFNTKKVATSYPEILTRFFTENKITAEIEEIGGSVEIATGIGLADAIFDIVSTGSTLVQNGLKEVEVVAISQAVMISNPRLSAEKQDILNQLLFRMEAVKNARNNKYILLNAPNNSLEEICAVLPGAKSPSILPLKEEGWSSVHSVVREDDFWEVIDQLHLLGAQGVLVTSLEKMIF